MILYAMYRMTLTPGNKECDAAIAHLREHTKLSLAIKKIIISDKGRANVPAEMMQEHEASSVKLGQLLAKCFADNPVHLEDCKWDTNIVLTTEEEASILAPAG